ncbi:uncharacterized protein ATC70_006824 [Mucor velutinosus]|uniref:Uncharacterized protein n=1 Tax=Mucor velutinosus TaxID=708070 RepID=A0AAN7HWA1_9FUNG|nr:hypothetical protein ATC70_006824 [Mucor velutinosus]
MASSTKKQSDNSDPPTQGGSMDSSHNLSNQLFTYQSFTDALKEQKRHNFETAVPGVDNNTFKPLNTYSTFIEAKKRNSIVIDCAQFLGMEFKVNGKVIEVNKTLDHTANESTYGNILTPQVELGGFPGTNLHLVWSQMKPICTDCHTDEYVRFDCPKRRRRLCHRRKSLNHLIAKCPVAPWNNKPTEASSETKPSQPQQPASQNQFEILNHEGEMEEVEESQENEEKDTEKSTSLDKDAKMPRYSSEPANKKPTNITPSVTQSAPRLVTRSNQTLKLTDVDKLTPLKSKRNLDDAISPNGQQETVPSSKKKNTKKE